VHGNEVTAALALASLVISLLVSHVRAEAEAAGLELTEGTVQRLERYVGLVLGLTIPGALLPVLVILTVLGVATTLQRFVTARRALRRST
jgi:CDP-diacylglycerol--glycerol-3-phosphate 3-phosphatidyltransferase